MIMGIFIFAGVVLVAGVIAMEICCRKKEFKIAVSYGAVAFVVAILSLVIGLALSAGSSGQGNAYMVEVGYVESQSSDGSIEIMSSGDKGVLKSWADDPAEGDFVLVLKSVWSGETMYIVLENGE